MEKRPVAYQIYSAREEAAQDLNAVLASLKAMGYDGVEFAGFYGHTAEEVKAMLDANGLKAISSHVPFVQIEEDMFGVISYTIINALAGNFKRIHWIMYVLTAIFIAKFALM